MTTLDETKVNEFLGKVVNDFGAALSSALVVLGDRLGLYKAMAGAGPLTPAELAERTGTEERYTREWLINQAAGGYVEYDPVAKCFTLPDEHAVALTNEMSPYFVAGGFQVVSAMARAEPRIAEVFRNGGGMLWGEHDPLLFDGTERFFRPNYIGSLVGSWIPALDGVESKLQTGARVADVGCGYGASTIIMAKAYPHSHFYGFDNHGPSIERAREAAVEAGVADRIAFEVADAADFYTPDGGYDLIAFFDCFHDLADPDKTAKRVSDSLADDGVAFIIEPMAGEQVEDNLNPIGRVYSAASTLCCVPNSLASGGPALGTIAPERQIRDIFKAAGLTRFRRAAETPLNRVFEVRR